jgi:RNA polymerase sporulation-specific sigma factor
VSLHQQDKGVSLAVIMAHHGVQDIDSERHRQHRHHQDDRDHEERHMDGSGQRPTAVSPFPAPRPSDRVSPFSTTPDAVDAVDAGHVHAAPPQLSAVPDVAASIATELTEVERLVGELGQHPDRHVPAPGSRAEEDIRLVLLARAGDQQAMTTLLMHYRPFTQSRARAYFVAGGDREDVVQEGMIGLYKAVRDYDQDRRASFRSFAELCITRQVQSAVKAATRHKHGPLNDYVSFAQPAASADDSDRVLADVLTAPVSDDPADLVVAAERLRALQAHVDEVLSDLETEVLRMWVDGRSYTEIAETLQRQVKSIDNALQRIKRKLESHLKAQDADQGAR